MTTELKTLFQNAARAAGIDVVFSKDFPPDCCPYIAGSGRDVDEVHWWNPATNSGDSRDLQVKLKISLETTPDKTEWIATKWEQGGVCAKVIDADPNMAVLLVAAALGKAMEGDHV